eukprot:gnl/TRDRNA2_/TRDRNA2_155605_c4_seq1.p1 gnl/TRDRNA2_/TRDRNA2_155605_c4~~gnl/TRDRNA2_/TRDRNA2_155605_c4_seq1.p1  ORF type:complete len:746 (-),score=134.79 gnl/TRDRNA2_/TRDRNA2_155605_c4_seq1:31-2181(-)
MPTVGEAEPSSARNEFKKERTTVQGNRIAKEATRGGVSDKQARGRGRTVNELSEETVSTELRDLCSYLRYDFTILARYPTLGPRTWTKLFEVSKVLWRASLPAAVAPVVAHQGPRGSSAGLPDDSEQLLVPTAPMQVPAPEDSSKELQRWRDSRYVLLEWAGVEQQESTLQQVEIQAAAVEAPKSRAKDADSSAKKGLLVPSTKKRSSDGGGGLLQVKSEAPPPGDEEALGTRRASALVSADASETAVRKWWPCQHASVISVGGTSCVAVRDLPFLVGQFRLFDTTRQIAGVPSIPMVTIYEPVSPAPTAELQALGVGAPRTLGVRLAVSLTAPGGTQRRATRCQVRFRALGENADCNTFQELEPTTLDVSGGDEVSILVREEDGLELGQLYEFAVRVGDTCRLGPWSQPSRPHKFAVPPPSPPEGSGLRVNVEADCANLSWPAFLPEADLASNLPGFMKLPVEYLVTVFCGTTNEPVTSVVTRDTQATVRTLSPSTAYSAVLSARWSRFGGPWPEGDAGRAPGGLPPVTGLMAAFVTSQSTKRLYAEVSMRLAHSGGSVAPVVASFPVDSTEKAAVTLDVDPFYASVQPPHLSAPWVRKPTAPPQPRQAAAPRSGEALADDGSTNAAAEMLSQADVAAAEWAAENGLAGAANGRNSGGHTAEYGVATNPLLPRIVPLPPPKFTTRDPLTFAPLMPAPPNSARAVAYPRRPAPPGH